MRKDSESCERGHPYLPRGCHENCGVTPLFIVCTCDMTFRFHHGHCPRVHSSTAFVCEQRARLLGYRLAVRAYAGKVWCASRLSLASLLLSGLVLLVAACSSDERLRTANISPTPGATTAAVTITRPEPGTVFTSSETTVIEVAVPDESALSRVEFYDNDSLHSTLRNPPFSHAWRVSHSVNGQHRWKVKLYDRSGNLLTTSFVDVRVDIPVADEKVAEVRAVVETEPVPHSKDAADDSAVWIHPTYPSLSTIIGTDKLGGLAVYDLTGKQLHYYADSKPNNVDLRYNFPLGGERVTLVTTTDRQSDSIRAYKVNPDTRGLEYVSARELRTGMQPYGLCMYNSPDDDRYYTFVSDNNGKVEQWELYDDAGKVSSRLARTMYVGSTTEGCVTDDEWTSFYVSEENVAIWKYGAEPDSGTKRTKVDSAGNPGRLESDIEGLAIYQARDGKGYLIASSQGNDTYVVYEREDDNAYVMTFAIVGGDVDGVSHTDGIEVSSFGLGSAFPQGVFIAQDDESDSDNQNFKLVPWESIAGSVDPPLSIESSWDPRKSSRNLDPAANIGATTYFIDSATGDDNNAGTSESAAWKTLEKASRAPLAPGDRLLLRRGGQWTGSLKITRSGTTRSPITIGSYSTGNSAMVRGGSSCIVLEGSHLVLKEIQIENCGWAGVDVSGSYARIQDCIIANNVAGVHVRSGATDSKILHNTIKDNDRMSVLTESPSTDDSGAFGVVLRGDRAEVAYNTISGSDAFSYDYGRDGAAVEIYGGRQNYIHHNLAIDNDVFSELGHERTSDNTYAYNVVRSSLPTSAFLVTRGDEDRYGPVMRTSLYHNTVYLTGGSSKGVVCHAGCSADILRMRNNILSVAGQVGYADAPFDEDYNLYHGRKLELELGRHSLIANPGFVDPEHDDLRLHKGSPAVDRGVDLGYELDFNGSPVPIGSPDIGAFERKGG